MVPHAFTLSRLLIAAYVAHGFRRTPTYAGVEGGTPDESALGLLQYIFDGPEKRKVRRWDVVWDVFQKKSRQLTEKKKEIPAVAEKLTEILTSNNVPGPSKVEALRIMQELIRDPQVVQEFSKFVALRRALAELRVSGQGLVDNDNFQLIRTLAAEITTTCFVQSPPKPPSLGSFFSGMYSLDQFIARGGQAEVWKGTDLKSARRVVVRLPLGMCVPWPCTVQELMDTDQDALNDMFTACEMSRLALARYSDRASDTRYLQQAPFAQCINTYTRSRAHDLAFDVWEFVGDVSLAHGFFMSSKLGTLTVESKRSVLRQLMEAVAVLADDFDRGVPCCCFRGEWCSTNFANTDVGWANATFMMLSGKRCPEQWIEAEDPYKCGPIVHHDINFNNVMLTNGPSAVFPTLIDFGAARRCRRGVPGKSTEWSPAYSQYWVPFWSADPHSFSKDQCWSYDIYAVGLAWLVMELLQEMPPQHLICNAAVNAGLIAGSSMMFRWGGAAEAPPVKLVYRCGGFDQDELLRQDAMQPVNELIRELHSRVFNQVSLSSEIHFVNKVQDFVVTSRKSLPESVRSLPLMLPESSVLIQDVYPMLKECPHFPSDSIGSHLTQRAEILCVWRMLTTQLSQAQDAKPSTAEEEVQQRNWVRVCKEMKALVEDFQGTYVSPTRSAVDEALKYCEKTIIAARAMVRHDMLNRPAWIGFMSGGVRAKS